MIKINLYHHQNVIHTIFCYQIGQKNVYNLIMHQESAIHNNIQEQPPWSLSTCSTRETGSKKPLLHLGHAEIDTFFAPYWLPPLLWWTFFAWSTKLAAEENLASHSGHFSNWLLLVPLPLLCPIPLNLEAMSRRLEVHLDDVVEDKLGFDSSLPLLIFQRLINEKLVSNFLGPGHLWSGPNLCFKQWSTSQSLHLIVFENTKVSLHPGTGHFFFFVAFS